MKEIILLSGTCGVGKSTFGESLQASGLAFVKPEEGANTEGQRAALAQKREFYLNNGISFAYECESLSEVEAIAKEAKTHGFATHLLFLGFSEVELYLGRAFIAKYGVRALNSPNLAPLLEELLSQVAAGLRDAVENFARVAKRCEKAYIYDNSTQKPKICFKSCGEVVEFVMPKEFCPQWVGDLLKGF